MPAASSSHAWWAIASRLHTPNTGMPRAKANVRAVTRPTRSPVNGPGPVPDTTALTSAAMRPALARTSAMAGATYSPWRRGSSVLDSASTLSPSWRATVMAEVAVQRFTHSRTGPPRAMADEIHGPGLVPPQRHFQVVLAEQLGHTMTPLDHRDGILERRIKIKVIELGKPGQPIGVDVDEVRALHQGGVYAGYDVRRRGDRTTHADALRDALDQGCLAGTQITRQHQQVPRGEQRPEPGAPRMGVLDGRQPHLKGGQGRAGDLRSHQRRSQVPLWSRSCMTFSTRRFLPRSVIIRRTRGLARRSM
jgi:hypothetical protein